MGLRSLAPGEPGYAAHYEGPPEARDAVYHQGTVWPWFIGAFVDAWLRVHADDVDAPTVARTRFVAPLLAHLDDAGLGHVSEIADAEAPFTPRGCPFQAWSVGELIRAERAVAEQAGDADGAAPRGPARGTAVHSRPHERVRRRAAPGVAAGADAAGDGAGRGGLRRRRLVRVLAAAAASPGGDGRAPGAGAAASFAAA